MWKLSKATCVMLLKVAEAVNGVDIIFHEAAFVSVT